MKYFPLLCLLLACQPAPPAETDYVALAQEICVCMTPLIDLNEEVLRTANANDAAAAEALIARVDEISDESEACAKRIEAKYGKLEAAEGPAAEKAFREHCPRMAGLLEANRRAQEAAERRAPGG